MTKKLSSDQILNLARLAKLRISEDEIEQYKNELSAILEYIEILDSVSVESLKPTSQVTGLVNVMRIDTVSEQKASPDELLSVVPDVANRYIKVKRMI